MTLWKYSCKEGSVAARIPKSDSNLFDGQDMLICSVPFSCTAEQSQII